MKDVVDFFKGLFEINKWPARWKCGEWSDFHGWLYITSELMIWASYFMIPVLILSYLSKKKAIIKFQRVYILFASFILLCGSTHFIDAMMFWLPMYRFNALVRLTTGVVSLFTVYHLIKILPQYIGQKTSVELENEILKREEAERKLADANKGLEAFAYVASHDLQEPLRKITTYTKILINNNLDQFDDKSKGIATKLVASSSRMQAMINDVLSLSTIAEDVEMKVVKTNKSIQAAIDDLEIKILEKQAIINVEDVPDVKGNEEYLSQLFMNLISNAIKFCKDRPVIDIRGMVENDTVKITVKDNGIGMDDKNIDKIFNAFQRLHSRSDYEGSGIGLAICKRIVDLHNGTIEVQSKVDEGTTFIVHLPKA